MQMKVCTKCGGDPKPITKFGKRGKKRSAQCKDCINQYIKDWKIKKEEPEQKHELLKNSNVKENPLFDKIITKVQKIQMLPGDVNSFVEVECPCGCGIMTKLKYIHSFDSQNDYYEGDCKSCFRLFKLTLTTTEDK